MKHISYFFTFLMNSLVVNYQWCNCTLQSYTLDTYIGYTNTLSPLKIIFRMSTLMFIAIWTLKYEHLFFSLLSRVNMQTCFSYTVGVHPVLPVKSICGDIVQWRNESNIHWGITVKEKVFVSLWGSRRSYWSLCFHNLLYTYSDKRKMMYIWRLIQTYLHCYYISW